ncbi:cell division protein PerM [Litorihabitans aurantiacus]|nr:DUF6350 family protein [Litorihabitans aurantiacus]
MSRPAAPRLTPRPTSSRGTAITTRPRTVVRQGERDRGGNAAGWDVAVDHAPDETDTRALELASPGGVSDHGGGRRWAVVEPVTRAPGVLRPQALRALRAGLEAVILSWLLVTVPVVAAYVATVSSPALGEASWLDAARSGSAGWLLGLGQEMTVVAADGTVTSVTLAPLALTLLTALALAGSVRRARLTHPVAFLVAAAAAGVAVSGAYTLAETSPTPRAVVTTLVLIAVAVTLGAHRSGALPQLPDHPWVAAGVAGARAGARLLVAFAALGAVTVLALVLVRAAAVVELQRALGPDALSTVVLVVAQLLALPTLAVWALAWWLGPGFSIGLVEVTTSGVGQGPLPVVPVLAALPQPGDGPGPGVVVLAVVIAAVVLVPVVRRLAADPWHLVAALAVATGVTGLVVGVAGGLSGGVDGAAIGPLTAVGTAALPLGVAAAGAAAGGGAIAWLLVWGAARLDLAERYPVLRSVAERAADARERAGRVLGRLGRAGRTGSSGARGLLSRRGRRRTGSR